MMPKVQSAGLPRVRAQERDLPPSSFRLAPRPWKLTRALNTGVLQSGSLGEGEGRAGEGRGGGGEGREIAAVVLLILGSLGV